MPPRKEAGRGELKVSLPLPLLRAFKHAIHDPVRGRALYGKAGSIIAGLLNKWLEENNHPTQITLPKREGLQDANTD